MRNEYCPYCDADQNCSCETVEVEHKAGNKKYKVPVPHLRCNACNHLMYDPNIGDPMVVLNNWIKDQEGMLRSFEVVRIRKQWRLSQEAFARLLGMSPASMNRYENDGLQDLPHDALLTACDNAGFMAVWFERHKHRLTTREQQQFRAALMGMLRIASASDEVDDYASSANTTEVAPSCA